MIEPLREALCSLPTRAVALPAPVAARLRQPSTASVYDYASGAVQWFSTQSPKPLCERAANEVVYQVFIECFAGFEGEVGTLCSFLCHLPFVISDLGASTIIALPILKRGKSGRKGRSPSPFAVADPSNVEPALRGFGPDLCANAAWTSLVAACEHIGVRLGMVIPMATIAIDSPAIRSEPELVYWWKASLDERLTGAPVRRFAKQPEAVPAADALHRFTSAPRAKDVKAVPYDGATRFIGAVGADTVTVANAYPDPVVGDEATYCWSDVATLRLGDLPQPQPYRGSERRPVSASAKRYLTRVLSHVATRGETVVLADVSSALPDEMVRNLCRAYPAQMVIAEQLWAFADRDPFEFVTGPLIPCVAAHHMDQETLVESFVHHLGVLRSTPPDHWFLAGVANHDSLPCAGPVARALLCAFVLLPGSVPFVYSGTEYGTTVPTNLEFGTFDLKRVRPDEGLLLFNHRAVERDAEQLSAFVAFWREVLMLRRSLGTAELPPDSVHDVQRCKAVVSFGIGAHRIVVNLGRRQKHVQLDRSPLSGALGSRVFSLDSKGLRIPALATVVLIGADTSIPFDRFTVFQHARGCAVASPGPD